MPLLFAILLIAFGIALLLFGLYLFYAWLPVLYGLFGFEIGFLLADRVIGFETASIIIGIILGIILAAATYVLEPYRRIVIGYAGGSVIALALLGLDRSMGGISVAFVAVCGGIAGAMLAAKFFDNLVIATTALGGAALSGLGAQGLLSLVGVSAGGTTIGFLITLALAAIGVSFQARHMQSWPLDARRTRAAPVGHETEPEERAQ
jgi:hypothetical protein